MEVVIANDLSVRLSHCDDLSRFKTTVAVSPDRLADLSTALDGIGEVESDQAVWISSAWLCDNSGHADDPAWRVSFDRMLEFAARHGWLRNGDRPMIRSHIEWASDRTEPSASD